MPRRRAPQPAQDLPEIIVQRSARRTKTVSAHFSGDAIVLAVPQRATRAQIAYWSETLVAKVVAKRRAAEAAARTRSTDTALEEMARRLSRTYLDGAARPTSVRWSTRQHTRWGSATPSTGTIRIARRLADAPSWVLETVVLHELVHLLEAHHNERFWELARRHPRANDAAQFLDGAAWAERHGAGEPDEDAPGGQPE
ncbi:MULTISPECIES: M48 family metallopeptidase [unclassified Kocuria]|uniref:M48 metallopeptidase family protein n=1 Tax=unclassified Kocuria TaxID=2649579 RepID=UPI000F88192E|nr:MULTISPECIES: M48 family metallopeptidase [unclassified Kocuria]RUP84500.1 M48 family peptidase [Kocuria sp. HSID17590]RUQ02980.1 M48 family peptidase [Kocuria sp. HSID17582]